MDKGLSINQLLTGMGILMAFLIFSYIGSFRVKKVLEDFSSEKPVTKSTYVSYSNTVMVPVNYYYAMENRLKEAGKQYLQNNNCSLVDYEVLKEAGLMEKILDGIDSSECDGYVKNNGLIKSYIYCTNYITEGY